MASVRKGYKNERSQAHYFETSEKKTAVRAVFADIRRMFIFRAFRLLPKARTENNSIRARSLGPKGLEIGTTAGLSL